MRDASSPIRLLLRPARDPRWGRAAHAGRRPAAGAAGKEWDVHESEWAVRANSLRLTFDAFCKTHERAWIGIARARLRDEATALDAVERMKHRLWQHWGRLLREKIPAFHAWALVKEEIGASLAERTVAGGQLPPQGPVPDWVVLMRRAAERAQHLAEAPGSHEELYAAVGGLSERRHDVLVLRYLLGLPDSVIAEYLDTTEANVRSTARQALDRLSLALRGRRGGQ
ncbi:sigma-70 family RNA polymerase sigma factor [Streptomyces sp. SID4948]|uniref:sigma-70 family RNA polymerase sigma factor n=1 Tax=Streptomyces sp. SID4948 TaxID=2690287 RepID=UPI0019285DE4|nr:sigma-70 family RNA polymerase sigma factor [Streptomyces sp. SID4948]